MRKLLFFLIVFCAHTTWGQNHEWHVRPFPYPNNYTNQGNGLSFETAMSLQQAFDNVGNFIQPGDTLWLHGDPKDTYNGVPTLAYKGHFVSNLKGTVDEPIIVSSYPGEWAVIDGNIHPFVPETVEPTFPCNSTTGRANNEESIVNDDSQEPSSVSDANDEDPLTGFIIDVKGEYVQYINFEITCLPSSETSTINRVFIDYEANTDFNYLCGISQAPPQNSPAANKFSNLVIRNIPGIGISSWKFAADSEIYGCIMYNNGYIRFYRTFDPLTSSYKIWTKGKGPSIYTQNDSNSRRRIENNVFANGYETAVLVWSATVNPDPGEDFLRNYDIFDNVFINNGEYGRKHRANIDPLATPEEMLGISGDSKPNLLISSDSSTPGANQLRNINIDHNFFYLNTKSSFVSGLRVTNADNVSITNNFIFKGDTGGQFPSNNKNLTFKNNFYWGKYINIGITYNDIIVPASGSTAAYTLPGYHTNNWQFDENTYFTRPNIATKMYKSPYGKIYLKDIYNNPPTTNTFQLLYNDEINSQRGGFIDPAGVTTMSNSNLSPIINITQNKYDSNLFYVKIFNPQSNVSSFNTIPVSFSDYNIPNGKAFKIRDVENYFEPFTGSTGIYDGTAIEFPMTLDQIEYPIGFFDRCVDHTANDFSVFTVEFECGNVPLNLTKSNITDNSAINYNAVNTITFGTNYVEETSGDIVAKAGRQIVLKGVSHFKNGGRFHGFIEDPCPSIAFVGEPSSGQNPETRFSNVTNSNSSKTITPVDTQILKIYPNPSSGIFTIENTQTKKISSVIIINMNSAKEVFNQKFENSTKVEINISKETKGLYVVKVFFEDGLSETKTIIKK